MSFYLCVNLGEPAGSCFVPVLGVIEHSRFHGMWLVSGGGVGVFLSDGGYRSFVPPFHFRLPVVPGLDRFIEGIQGFTHVFGLHVEGNVQYGVKKNVSRR